MKVTPKWVTFPEQFQPIQHVLVLFYHFSLVCEAAKIPTFIYTKMLRVHFDLNSGIKH